MSRPECLGCLRNPAHQILDEGVVIAEFCEQHYAELEATLERAGKRLRKLIASGMHYKFAERVLVNEMRTAGGSRA